MISSHDTYLLIGRVVNPFKSYNFEQPFVLVAFVIGTLI